MNTRKSLWAGLAMVLAFAMVLAACAPQPATPEATQPPAAATEPPAAATEAPKPEPTTGGEVTIPPAGPELADAYAGKKQPRQQAPVERLRWSPGKS